MLNVRLQIDGKLLQALKEEASKEFRTPTQHIRYLINKHFEDRVNALERMESANNSPVVTNSNHESPRDTSGNEEYHNDDIDDTSSDTNVTSDISTNYDSNDNYNDNNYDDNNYDSNDSIEINIDDDIANF